MRYRQRGTRESERGLDSTDRMLMAHESRQGKGLDGLTVGNGSLSVCAYACEWEGCGERVLIWNMHRRHTRHGPSSDVHMIGNA